MDEKPSTFAKGAKYILGIHRGPLPSGRGDDYDAEHVETAAAALSLEKKERTRAQKLRRHWARFWCCYIFWNIIFLAIFLPIFFLVILPAISQRVLDNSTLVLVKADILKPRPDSAMFTVESALKLPIGLPVRIDPMTLNLFNRDSPGNSTWGRLFQGPYTVKGNTTLEVDNQYTPLNVPQWTQYVHDVVFMAHAPLSVWGTTTAYLGKLKANVKLDKDVKQNTLNSFAGFSITDTQILLPAESDGTNLIANATLPNPSVLTLEIGTVVMDLKSGDLVLGNVTIDNLTLIPGNHANPVRGILDLGVLIKNIEPILQTQRESLLNGYLSLNTTGTSVVYDGVLIPYYTEVMKSLTMTAQVPIGSLLLNTLKGILVKNGTNILQQANGTGSASPQALSDALNQLKNLNLSNPDNTLSKRSMNEFLDYPEKRSSLINILEGFL